MKNEEFHKLFTTEFVEPLIEQGFCLIGRGNSLRYASGNRELLILRQGGRLARPGFARSVICFRHSFLRPIASDDPKKSPIYVQDCSRKLIFDDFDGWNPSQLNYRPENSGRWRIHDTNYANGDEGMVRSHLRELRKTVVARILPWLETITEKGELSQIKRFGENAWCEQRWIEDYEAFLSQQP
ncbi:hypothetical protein [Sulfitobacter aestuariivivens]|uniref:Uncharacterized protein n=1 Tax=Sulfitobacter aestuariivivens TaxID=2766981 RepID=A0A927D2I0_9RHOB|nr:hypothetical protein [Sulfitobacter aestuariivivens]MBD3663888.1 hypothetical protein [Sulfitobacter aestuariivivens]